MWKIIKQRLAQFLLELLRDVLTNRPDEFAIAARPKPIPPRDPASDKRTQYWRVTGTAHLTHKVTGGPHEGLIGRCLWRVERVVTLTTDEAYDDWRQHLIDKAREAEHQDVSQSGFIFGAWHDKPKVEFLRADEDN